MDRRPHLRSLRVSLAWSGPRGNSLENMHTFIDECSSWTLFPLYLYHILISVPSRKRHAILSPLPLIWRWSLWSRRIQKSHPYKPFFPEILLFLQEPEFTSCVPTLGTSPDYTTNNLVSACNGMELKRVTRSRHTPFIRIFKPFPGFPKLCFRRFGAVAIPFPVCETPYIRAKLPRWLGVAANAVFWAHIGRSKICYNGLMVGNWAIRERRT